MGGKAALRGQSTNCQQYVDWRIEQSHRHAKSHKSISDQTARHELKALRAAIRYWSETRGLDAVPTVTLPQRSPQRQGYWLTRKQVADRIRAARRSPLTKHLARFFLIGVYSGTRPGAILKLAWMPSPAAGWFDLDAEIFYRRGMRARRARNKNQPPARIHQRLLPHLRRWRAADLAHGIAHVVHYRGKPVAKLRRSWDSVRAAAEHPNKDAPHICRHTAATWQMQAGTDLFEAASYLGMSPETLWREYGHHHPNFQSKAARAVPGRSAFQSISRKPPEQNANRGERD